MGDRTIYSFIVFNFSLVFALFFIGAVYYYSLRKVNKNKVKKVLAIFLLILFVGTNIGYYFYGGKILGFIIFGSFVFSFILIPILSVILSISVGKYSSIKVENEKIVESTGKTDLTIEPIFNNSEEKILDMYIQNALVDNNYDNKKTIKAVIVRRIILSVLFAIANVILITLIFFHISSFIYVFIVLNLIVFTIVLSKINNISYLKKQIKARPDEKISDVVAGKIYNSRHFSPLFYGLIIIIFSVLPFIYFSKPRFFFEERENGYDLRFYTIGLSEVRKIEVPSTHNGKPVIGIRGDVFSNIDSIEEIVLPDSIEIIRGKTFMNDSNLRTINIPNKLTYLGGSAFKNCSSLESIVLPDTLEEINGNTFEGCSSLRSIKLGNNIKKIHGYAFKDCSSLPSIDIPDSLEEIGGYAFSSCKNIESITMGDNVKRIGGGAFIDCSKLSSVKLSNSLTEISGNMFENCYSLRNITLPKGITRIGGNAFYRCGLTSITIPEGVTRIGGHAFQYNYALSEVNFPMSLQDIGSSAFRNCDKLYSVKVPCGISINTRAFKESPTTVTCEGGYGYSIRYYTSD